MLIYCAFPLHRSRQRIFGGSVGSSAIRRFPIDLVMYEWGANAVKQALLDGFGADFFADLAVKQMQRKGEKRAVDASYHSEPSCKYY